MKRLSLRKHALSGAATVLAAALAGGVPAAAAPQSTDSPWNNATSASSASAQARSGVSVYFQDYGIAFPSVPVIINERMMVPGIALLQGIGYETEWDAGKGELTAKQTGKVSFVYRKNRLDAEIGGKTVQDLPAAPFVRDDILWLPLRVTLEACGMSVSWDSVNRMAIVKDPQALPKFSVAVKASGQSLAGQPSNLETMMKDNMKVNASIDLIDPEHYRDKINLMIAAGDLKSLMLVPGIHQYPDSLIPSISLDLTDELENYPRLKVLATQSGRGFVSDGRIYGIPLPQDPNDAPFPAVRQDWLDVLGLAQPKTMEEMYEVFKAFTNYDPDGNGKHDTYGMTGYTNAAGLGSFAWVEQAYTGSPGRFSVKDGLVVDHAVSDDEVQALQWLARAYEEGLIDKEFPVMNESQAFNRIRDNYSGTASLSLDEAASLSSDSADWVPLPSLKADAFSAPIAPWATQGTGTYIVTKMSKVDPKIILAWLERGMEMTEKGEWEQTESPQSPLTASDRSSLRSLFGSSDLLQEIRSQTGLSDADRTIYEAAVKEWRKTSYEGASVPGIDRLWSSGKYAELNSKLEQLKIKVILGAASIEDWKTQVHDLTMSEEYRQMMVELNQLISD